MVSLVIPSVWVDWGPLKSSFAPIPVGLGREISLSAEQLGSTAEFTWSSCLSRRRGLKPAFSTLNFKALAFDPNSVVNRRV